MTKETIILAELDIDIKKLLESQSQIDKQISALIDIQYELMESGKQSSKQFKENAVTIDKLNGAYNAQAATLKEQLALNARLITNQQQLENALATTNATENEYIANNEKLIALKKELNVNSGNYKKNIELINDRLQENNNWLKENGSAYTKVVTTMSDYKDQALDSFNSINVLNGGLAGLISRAQEAGGAGPLLKGAFEGMTTGIMGMTRSAMAFIATPFGVVLAALAAVFALVQNAMNSSSESAGKITKIFSTFSIITDSLMKVLEPLGSFLINGIAMGFEAAGKAAEAAMGFIADGLAFLGFDDAAEDVRGFTADIKDTVAKTEALKKAKEELAAQMTVQEENNEKAKQQIDGLIKKTKDQALTEQQRKQALEQAAQAEKKNFTQRQALAQKAYDDAINRAALGKKLTQDEIENLQRGGAAYAEKLMKVKGFTQQEIDAIAKANVAKMKLVGEEKTMHEKHIADRNKLQDDFEAEQQKREQQEADRRQRQQKLLDDAIEKQSLELRLLIAQQGIKAKTLQEELALAEKVAATKKSIAQAEYNASAKTANDKLKLDIANQEITNELAKTQMDVAVANAETAFNEFVKNNQSKLDNSKFITAEMVANEHARLDSIAQAEQQYHHKRLLAGAINETEYQAQLKQIADTTQQAKDDATAQRDADVSAKQAIDLENKKAADTANMDYDLGFQLSQLDAKKQQELDAAEQTGADKSLIEAKYAQERKNTEKQVLDNKLSLAHTTFGNMATIMGKESAAGKAMAVAQATIDTYKSAVSAYSSMAGIPVVGPALGAAAAGAAVVAGMQNIKKITATKPPKAEKGALFSIGGNRHSAGGTLFTGEDGTAFEAEQGELIGVMNRNAARHFMAFNNAFPSGGASAPNYFAGGGIVSREIASPALNTDELAAKIAEANRAMPAPVVSVQDIVAEGNSYVRVRDGANF